MIRFGAVTLVPDERLLTNDGQPVSLTPKAFDVLAVLAANPGRLVTKRLRSLDIWMRTDFGASPHTQALVERELAQTQAQLAPTTGTSHTSQTTPERRVRCQLPVRSRIGQLSTGYTPRSGRAVLDHADRLLAGKADKSGADRGSLGVHAQSI
jgi:hypothetical protein